MGEIWKKIDGFNYKISSYGNVMNDNGLILKPWNQKGYWFIDLCKDGKKYRRGIHRLVAETYIENPNNYPFACHKDGNSLNNKLTNLYWGTPKQNQLDRKKHGTDIYLKGEECTKAKLTDKEVYKIKAMYKKGTFGYIAVSKVFGVHWSTIRAIIKNRNWKHI